MAVVVNVEVASVDLVMGIMGISVVRAAVIVFIYLSRSPYRLAMGYNSVAMADVLL